MSLLYKLFGYKTWTDIKKEAESHNRKVSQEWRKYQNIICGRCGRVYHQHSLVSIYLNKGRVPRYLDFADGEIPKAYCHWTDESKLFISSGVVADKGYRSKYYSKSIRYSQQTVSPPATKTFVAIPEPIKPQPIDWKTWYYTVYLQSDWWKQRRAEYYKTHKQECVVCLVSYGLHLHHRNYNNLWKEKDEDLVCLCGLHHSRVGHGIGG